MSSTGTSLLPQKNAMMCVFFLVHIISAIHKKNEVRHHKQCASACGRAGRPVTNGNWAIHRQSRETRFKSLDLVEDPNESCNLELFSVIVGHLKTTSDVGISNMSFFHRFADSLPSGTCVSLVLENRQWREELNRSVCVSFSFAPQWQWTPKQNCLTPALFVSTTLQSCTGRLLSGVVDVSLYSLSASRFTKTIRITFVHRTDSLLKSVTVSPVCVFWDDREAGWSSRGCRVVSSNGSHTLCQCRHLSSFAVMVNVAGKTSQLDQFLLVSLSYIGCVLSMFSVLCVYFTFTFFRNLKSIRHSIHKHLSFSLFFGYSSYLLGSSADPPGGWCLLTAILQHYWWLCSFAWMSLEGVDILLLFSPPKYQKYRTENSKWRKSFVWGYLIPFIIVLWTALISAGGMPYYDSHYCFLNQRLIWNFVGPLLLVVVFNSGVLTFSMYLMLAHSFSSKKKTKLSMLSKIGMYVKGFSMISSVLCIPWVLGILDLHRELTIVFPLLHVLFNSTQGVWVFVLHCLLNQRVKMEYRRYLANSRCLPEPLKPRQTFLGGQKSSVHFAWRKGSLWKTKSKMSDTACPEHVSLIRADAFQLLLSGWDVQDNLYPFSSMNDESSSCSDLQDDNVKTGHWLLGFFLPKSTLVNATPKPTDKEGAQNKALTTRVPDFFSFLLDGWSERVPEPEMRMDNKGRSNGQDSISKRKRRYKKKARTSLDLKTDVTKTQIAFSFMRTLKSPSKMLKTAKKRPKESSKTPVTLQTQAKVETEGQINFLAPVRDFLAAVSGNDSLLQVTEQGARDKASTAALVSLNSRLGASTTAFVLPADRLVRDSQTAFVDVAQHQQLLFKDSFFVQDDEPSSLDDDAMAVEKRRDKVKARGKQKLFRIFVTKPDTEHLVTASPSLQKTDLLFGKDSHVDLEVSDSLEDLPTLIVEELKEESQDLDDMSVSLMSHKYRILSSNIQQVPRRLLEVSQYRPILKEDMGLVDVFAGNLNPEILIKSRGHKMEMGEHSVLSRKVQKKGHGSEGEKGAPAAKRNSLAEGSKHIPPTKTKLFKLPH